jgi:hypothetical protein
MSGSGEDGPGKGGVGQPLSTGDYSPPPEDFHADVKKMRGRPRKATTPGEPASPSPQEQSAPPAPVEPSPLDTLRDRQRADCEALAGEVARLRSLPDLGAGREGNQAAALGTLTRATAALHEMERAAYGLGMDAAQGRDRVILLPVPVDSMEAWARQAAAVMGLPADAPAPAQVGQGFGPRRVKE